MSETPKRPNPASPPPAPRWVQVIVILSIVLILAVIILHLMGFEFGSHGSGGLISHALLMERAAGYL
jgi:hypothetical protein